MVLFWWWLVVFPWCVSGSDVMCCDVKWLVARWDEGMWLAVR